MMYESPYGGMYDIRFVTGKYQYGFCGPALRAVCKNEEFGFWEPFATVTVNLDRTYYHSNDPNAVYIDTNNNPGMDKFLADNGLAEFTGMYGFSGYCVYPQMRLDMDKIKEIELKEEEI